MRWASKMILGIFGGIVLFIGIALAVKRQKDIVIEGIPKLNRKLYR